MLVMLDMRIERCTPRIADLLERLDESERRFEAALAEQDRQLAECLELVRRMSGGRP